MEKTQKFLFYKTHMRIDKRIFAQFLYSVANIVISSRRPSTDNDSDRY